MNLNKFTRHFKTIRLTWRNHTRRLRAFPRDCRLYIRFGAGRCVTRKDDPMSVSDLISAYEAEREAHAVALEDGDLATIQREMATPISESATEPFTSRFGVDYHCRGDCWAVTLSGFTDSICQTEPEARDRAEKLEVLEAQYHDRRRKSNVA